MLRSAFGRVLIGIRDNEPRMRSLGFPTFRYKLACFVLAGALAGLAGYLTAVQDGIMNPEQLGWHRSGEALVMVILGGMGTLAGPALGAGALMLLELAVLDLDQVLAAAAGRLHRRGGAVPARRPGQHLRAPARRRSGPWLRRRCAPRA